MKANFEDLRYWPILNHLPAASLRKIRLVYVIGHSGNDVLLTTNDDELLVFGSNSWGGLGEKGDETYYARSVDSFKKIEELSKKRIKGFAFTAHSFDDMFVVAYLENGEVYSWGYVPKSSTIRIFKNPSLIESLPKTVTEVACGSGHVLALTSDGEVFGWGLNNYAQAGYASNEVITNPLKAGGALSSKLVVKISCGFHFSSVLTSDGSVYSWGRNDKGQLGINSTKEVYCGPSEVVFLRDTCIKDIACGSNHVLTLDGHGDLFSWGSNACRQLGSVQFEQRCFPLRLNLEIRFKEVAAHVDLSVGVSCDGSVMVWGKTGGAANRLFIQTPCRTIDEAFALFNCGRMYKPFEIASENESVSETVRKSFGNQEDSDFKFIIEKKEIHVHKTVLKLRSQYFKRMFHDNWLEANKSSAEVDENYEAMVAFLKYLYTNELDVDPRVALDVSVIADEYCETSLYDVCLRKFEQGLNDVNLAELYELTYERQMKDFIELCVDFASHNLKAIITSEGYRNWKVETLRSFFEQDKIIQACGK